MSTTDPTASNNSNSVCPGQRVGHIEDFHAGQGTYVRKQYIYSSVVGYKEITQQSDKPIISIVKEKEPSIVPEIHSIVTARVTKVNPRYASLAIFCVGTKMLKEPYVGIIR
jgi:exosome complex component CSL4